MKIIIIIKKTSAYYIQEWVNYLCHGLLHDKVT